MASTPRTPLRRPATATPKPISATTAVRRFASFLGRARYGGESFVVFSRGEPVAIIAPIGDATLAEAGDEAGRGGSR